MIRLLFTSGRGPAECRMAIAKSLDALARDAVRQGCDCQIAAGENADGFGPASAIAILSCEGSQTVELELADTWIGGLVWVAKSPLRPHHKRKNWFVAVTMLPDCNYPPLFRNVKSFNYFNRLMAVFHKNPT